MWYWFVRGFLGLIARILFNIKVERTFNIPDSGAVVLCANHVSWWDPVLVANATRRPIHFMAKGELFKNPLLAALMRRIHTFPVERGKADLSAIRDSISVLKNQQALGIFPEGTRQRGLDVLGEMHPGAAMVALKTGSPVVPIAIRGRYAFRGTVTVVFGEPLILQGSTGRASKDMEEGARTITEAIKVLWDDLGEEVA